MRSIWDKECWNFRVRKIPNAEHLGNASSGHMSYGGTFMNFRNSRTKRIAACIIAGLLVLAMIAPLLAALS